MDVITPPFVLILSTAVVAITMFLSGLLLWGWRRGRLRTFNLVVVFAIAVVAFAEYRRRVTEDFDERLLAGVWAIFAAISVYGLIGMLKLAKSDPPVFGHLQRHSSRTVSDGGAESAPD